MINNDSRASWGRCGGAICRRVETDVVLVLEPVLTEYAKLGVGVASLPDPLPLLGPLLVVQKGDKVVERQTCNGYHDDVTYLQWLPRQHDGINRWCGVPVRYGNHDVCYLNKTQINIRLVPSSLTIHDTASLMQIMWRVYFTESVPPSLKLR